MKSPVIPDPPLVHWPAARKIRFEWIGRFVRMGRRHMKEPDENHPRRNEILANQRKWRDLGVGQVLDVGRSSWFLIRWSNGIEEEQHKKDLDVYQDEATALAYGPRLFPRDFGGGAIRMMPRP